MIPLILGALIMIAKNNAYFIKEEIWLFSQYLISDIDMTDYPKLEQSYMRKRFFQLAKATHQKQSFDELFQGHRKNNAYEDTRFETVY